MRHAGAPCGCRPLFRSARPHWEAIKPGSRSAVLRRSEQTRSIVCERRRSRRANTAIRAKRALASEAIKHAAGVRPGRDTLLRPC
jgi:hypothetical protein